MLIESSNTTITNFYFDDTMDLLIFLYRTEALQNWEVPIARLSASSVVASAQTSGLTMDLKTKRYDRKGNINYLTFVNIKSLIGNFMRNNIYMSVDTELKFKYPDDKRHIWDVYDIYSAFWLNCYSNTIANLAYMNISYLENAKELSVDPVNSWAVYIHSLYDNYIIWKRDNYDVWTQNHDTYDLFTK